MVSLKEKHLAATLNAEESSNLDTLDSEWKNKIDIYTHLKIYFIA